jgi:hypothetical protein
MNLYQTIGYCVLVIIFRSSYWLLGLWQDHARFDKEYEYRECSFVPNDDEEPELTRIYDPFRES